ncbi:RNA polymerase sigma-70 factor [Chitinophaga sp. Cy-1792]|uniref:RNA polymerase sigma factor n=1 Tax=Chitinophaga sp. Cy-1792 TaxID=2608339 RepID=UPI00141D7724
MPAVPQYDESAILEKVAKGDEAAFTLLFDHNWNTVYGVAFALTKSADMAEEMTQEVFVKLWLNREKLAAVDNLKGYLFMVARNQIYNAFRRKIKSVSFTDHLMEYIQAVVPATESTDAKLLSNELEQLVAKAVEQLSPQQHTIYCLSRYQGMSQEEIANTLHISVHTVKSHMNKALHTIRDYLKNHAVIEMALISYFLTNAIR